MIRIIRAVQTSQINNTSKFGRKTTTCVSHLRLNDRNCSKDSITTFLSRQSQKRCINHTYRLIFTSTSSIIRFNQQTTSGLEQQQWRSYSSSSSSQSNKGSESYFSYNKMKLNAAPVVLLFTTAAVLSLQPVPLCRAEKFRFFSSSSKDESSSATVSTVEVDEKKKKTLKLRKDGCPYFGCPLKPTDVHYNKEDIKKAFEDMRDDKRVNVSQTSAARILKNSANDEHVTLTLIGYKGGDLASQINQDRALIVTPYVIHDEESEIQKKNVETFVKLDRTLLGVFDGHAPLGERVSDYTATELPDILAEKLVNKAILKNTTLTDTETEIEITKEALIETFIQLDKTVPASPSGGCTASVILRQGNKVYIANAGDSRSFLAAYRPSTQNVTILYISREDKPSLPDERARVEAAGGQVYIPVRGTSRVVYHDPVSGAPTGLAMSRSIGDWEAGNMGVIPDPIVDVVDIQDVVTKILREDIEDPDSFQVDLAGNIMVADRKGGGGDGENSVDNDDDVYLFAVSATDGMMDYLSAAEISRVLAHSLFDDAGAHPVTAVEHLIFAAANAWQQAKQGRYRDDIAIAVSALRRPPNTSTGNVLPQ